MKIQWRRWPKRKGDGHTTHYEVIVERTDPYYKISSGESSWSLAVQTFKLWQRKYEGAENTTIRLERVVTKEISREAMLDA